MSPLRPLVVGKMAEGRRGKASSGLFWMFFDAFVPKGPQIAYLPFVPKTGLIGLDALQVARSPRMVLWGRKESHHTSLWNDLVASRCLAT